MPPTHQPSKHDHKAEQLSKSTGFRRMGRGTGTESSSTREHEMEHDRTGGPANRISPAAEQDGQPYANQRIEAAYSMEITKEAEVQVSQLLSQDLHRLKLTSKEPHHLQERNPPQPDPVTTGSIDPSVYNRKFSFASGLSTDIGLSNRADLSSLEASDIADNMNEETTNISEESTSAIEHYKQSGSDPFWEVEFSAPEARNSSEFSNTVSSQSQESRPCERKLPWGFYLHSQKVVDQALAQMAAIQTVEKCPRPPGTVILISPSAQVWGHYTLYAKHSSTGDFIEAIFDTLDQESGRGRIRYLRGPSLLSPHEWEAREAFTDPFNPPMYLRSDKHKEVRAVESGTSYWFNIRISFFGNGALRTWLPQWFCRASGNPPAEVRHHAYMYEFYGTRTSTPMSGASRK